MCIRDRYLERVEYMCNHIGLNIQDTGADTSYGTSLIYHEMKRMGIRLHTPKSTDGETYKAEPVSYTHLIYRSTGCGAFRIYWEGNHSV